MTEFEILIRYGNSQKPTKAVIEYESSQIMRIRIHGRERSILLETNFPMIQHARGKAMTWKLREGYFNENNSQTAAMLSDIMHQLEDYLKGKSTRMTNQEYLGKTKW